ncbi:fumarylacetoacetate hydrolase family protein [Amycolatopsis acidicola]|uniref:Fumarylacetoacetate hydrolase family protein n=1 Tax=Amycolatopsis acidicola TaxID=2596893 RepID=A0A5N0UZR4_9PSEU|nr:fumarylacetoacetate hydrolase family protein [Amycolatopsis acidicola]KAA9158710.1 fumarylacetoacetate hydrolase family protein [Amycolatopsis acidicola]
MRWCRIAHGGREPFGLVTEDKIELVDGTPFGEYRRTGERVALDDARLLPPVLPPTFFAVGFNYTAHVRESSKAVLPERPEVGYRAQGALIGHGEAVVKPADCTGRFESEAELVAVIGRSVRRCSRDEAAAAVFGWTIGNDVSAREWQHGDRTFWRAKNSDTFKPMGPWIETGTDPLTARTTVAVDGTEVAGFDTGAMIFDPYDYIREISRYITLRPGDVLWMGTDATVEMVPGTTLAVSITGIGTLRNPIVLEEDR